MNIALIGNCQLSMVGQLLNAFFGQNGLEHNVVYSGSLYDLGGKNTAIVPFFKSLSSADIIYGHYHAERWDVLSTNSMTEYFSLKLVPNLYSPTSYPQISSFTEGGHLNLQLMCVDFRMLEMYLNGIDVNQAPKYYSQVRVNDDESRIIEENTAQRYKSLFDSGKLVFDYSAEYIRAMKHEKTPYFTYNHPNNNQLQWLINQILLDMKINISVDMKNLEPLIWDTFVPELGAEFNERYRIRGTEVGLDVACKIYYALFSTYEKAFLEKEFKISNYRMVCVGDV